MSHKYKILKKLFLEGILKKGAQQNLKKILYLKKILFWAKKANSFPKGEVDLEMYVLPRQLWPKCQKK